MPNYRTAEISCDLFQGYRVKIDLDYVNSNHEIVVFVIGDLQLSLKDKNLEILLERSREKKFHIHMGYGDILLSESTDTIWVCSHC